MSTSESKLNCVERLKYCSNFLINNPLLLEDVQKGRIESIVCTAHFAPNTKQIPFVKSSITVTLVFNEQAEAPNLNRIQTSS